MTALPLSCSPRCRESSDKFWTCFGVANLASFSFLVPDKWVYDSGSGESSDWSLRVWIMIMSTVLSPEHEVRSFIAKRVAEGFDSEEDIVEDALEYFADEFEDGLQLSVMARNLASEHMAYHLAEERNWQDETDCDRLDNAFDELERLGIVARQNFTCCQTCGHAEIWEEIEQVRQDSEVRGYVFYHMQDTDRVLEEGRLYLAYGSLDNTDESTVLVARKVVEIMRKFGFRVDWNGSLDKRICLEELVWRRRRNS
jgi:hypothetical protein